MPQIKEAENEDKDYSNDRKGTQSPYKLHSHIKGGTNPPSDQENNDVDAAYSYFQKDSEPGNR